MSNTMNGKENGKENGTQTKENGSKELNHPMSLFDMPRCGGITSMYRLPVHEDSTGLDACFIGIPFDSGSNYRPGSRFGPRHIRVESVMVRHFNQDTGAAPFDSINVGDIGDVNFNMYDIKEACKAITKHFSGVIANGCRPLTMGGDHTITYPILRAFKEKYGPVGLVHIDAHTDCNDEYNGAKITHGTTFRRAFEDGLLDPTRVVQIGIRGTGYSHVDAGWGIQQGFRVVPAVQCWNKSLVPLMEEVRQQMGDKPVYISFDIDGLDPSFAPGTGTPEIGGLTTIQGLEIIRGCQGLNIVGCDLVEVSPQYDHGAMTSVTAANLLFEMLCVLPGVVYKKSAFDKDYLKWVKSSTNGVQS